MAEPKGRTYEVTFACLEELWKRLDDSGTGVADAFDSLETAEPRPRRGLP